MSFYQTKALIFEEAKESLEKPSLSSALHFKRDVQSSKSNSGSILHILPALEAVGRKR